jgi:type VI secretion system protein ImpG
VYNKYYQDELSYLRELGKEFALANPEAAHFVGESSSDPEVERLLEGFSFLTARIRQKLDDEIPEFTHALVEMFWPHYLRPVPSMSVLQFEALPQAAKTVRPIPRGAEVQSVPVDGTPCRFRTAYDVTLQPWTIESLTARTDAQPALRLRFRVAEGVSLKKLGLQELRLHLAGDAAVSRALYLCLCRYLKRITVQAVPGGTAVPLERGAVKPAGFGAEQLLLPFPAASFQGFRLLQEYFAFPSKFMFVDVTGLNGLQALGDASSFDLTFELTQLPRTMPPVNASHVLLHCTPAVNLFPHEADPIRLDHERVEYRLRPAGGQPEHYEIYTIDKVSGVASGAAVTHEYHPFLRFARRPGDEARLYRHRLQPSVVGGQADVFISLLHSSAAGGVPDVATISTELTCTNRQLPSKLMIGDVSAPSANSPNFAKFRNITRPTPSISPTLGSDLHWRLLSHLALNYLSLADLEALRRLIGLYHFRARSDRQAEHSLKLLLQGLKQVKAAPATRLFQGTPIRGLNIDIDVDEESLGGEGETYLLGTVLNELFAQYVSLNAFCRLTLNGTKFGEIHQWPSRMGDRILL